MQSQTSPINAAATLAQKAMLVRALQGAQAGQQQQVANGMMPGTNATMAAADPAMQQQIQTQAAAALANNPQMALMQQNMNGLPIAPAAAAQSSM